MCSKRRIYVFRLVGITTVAHGNILSVRGSGPLADVQFGPLDCHIQRTAFAAMHHYGRDWSEADRGRCGADIVDDACSELLSNRYGTSKKSGIVSLIPVLGQLVVRARS